MSINELLCYLLLIIIGYCMGKILLNSYESYESYEPPWDKCGACGWHQPGNTPYKQIAWVNGGDHEWPLEDYCEKVGGKDKTSCESVFYKDAIIDDYKICRFDDTTKKCTSEGGLSCDYWSSKITGPSHLDCQPGYEIEMCCSTQKYNSE